MKKGLIYKLINNENGKCYVGLTVRSFNERMSDYQYYHENPNVLKYSAIMRAINDCGWDNFTKKIIEDNIPDDELDAKEIFYIDKNNCLVPNGYNIHEGGRIEAVKKMGKSNSKPVYRIDVKTFEIIDYANSMYEMAQRVGSSATAISNICYGSDKQGNKRFISKGFTYRLIDEYDPQEVFETLAQKRKKDAKPVVAYFLDKIEPIGSDGSIQRKPGSEIIDKYNSIYEASTILKISSGNISDYCKGKRSFAGKFKGNNLGRKIGFVYLNDKLGNLNAIATRKSHLNSERNNDTLQQPVELYEVKTGVVLAAYKNYEEAKEHNRTLSKAKYRKSISTKTPFAVKNGVKVGWRLIV